MPLFLALRPLQKRVNGRYTVVRERVGAMLGAISEAVVGAETIRAYGVGRADAAPDRRVGRCHAFGDGAGAEPGRRRVLQRRPGGEPRPRRRGRRRAPTSGIAGEMSVGQAARVPVPRPAVHRSGPDGDRGAQRAAERGRGLAPGARRARDARRGGRRGSRRRAEPARPGDARAARRGLPLPGRPAGARSTSTSSVPAGTSVAVVGATGSGKTTIAKLVARFMDPTAGAVLLDGVDLRDIPVDQLRRRDRARAAGGVPVRRHARGEHRVRPAFRRRRRDRLRADDAARPARPSTRSAWRTGSTTSPPGWARRSASAASRCPRGSGSSSPWRARTWPTPTCCSSTRRPRRSTRRPRCASRAPWSRSRAGRSTVTIAHRLSTAEAADAVVVVDAGRVVEIGHHDDLVAREGHYAALHAAWVSQTR